MNWLLYISFACIFACLGSDIVAGQTPTGDSSGPSRVISAAVKIETIPAAADLDQKYRIGYDDKVEVQVFRHPELTQRVSVTSKGTINLFRLQEPLMAVCKTEQELADSIATAYQKDYLRNPDVHVQAVEQRSQSFSVIGSVEKPGSFFLNRKVRLIELLAFAGGPTKESGSRLFVARSGSTSNCKSDASADDDDRTLLDFRIDDVMKGKQDLVMQPGDVVSVGKKDVIYIYGNVNKQGQIPISEPITLTQALASAEGLKPATNKDNIRILRQKPGTLDREEFVYSLSDIDKRKVQDPYLEPNDIVAISEDRSKAILNSIGRSLTSGFSTIFYRIP
ncbi:MAG: polysaccharide biosynthesis/export family protein [Acidobacteriota bacterium]